MLMDVAFADENNGTLCSFSPCCSFQVFFFVLGKKISPINWKIYQILIGATAGLGVFGIFSGSHYTLDGETFNASLASAFMMTTQCVKSIDKVPNECFNFRIQAWIICWYLWLFFFYFRESLDGWAQWIAPMVLLSLLMEESHYRHSILYYHSTTISFGKSLLTNKIKKKLIALPNCNLYNLFSPLIGMGILLLDMVPFQQKMFGMLLEELGQTAKPMMRPNT